MNMIDYIKWRKDLTFDERGINEIDSLLFSYLSYEMFDDFILNQRKTIKEISDAFFKKYDEKTLDNRLSFSKKSYLILKEMANAPRYQSLILSNYVNEINPNQDVQFSALTIQYQEKWKYIAFRGTDATFTGWKEDFSMTYKEEVLSQRKAVEYLTHVFHEESLFTKLFKKYDYYIGGHSKGGNLAIYAASFVSNDIQKRIQRVDNFDGQGFESDVWEKQSMKNICSKVHTYIPTSSLFGRLFEHREKVSIIKSNQFGVFQHDPLSWFVELDHFIYEESGSNSSEKAIDELNQILLSYNKDERKELIESLFNIFKRLDIYTFDDLLRLDMNRVLLTLKELRHLNGEQIKIMIELIRVLLKVRD